MWQSLTVLVVVSNIFIISCEAYSHSKHCEKNEVYDSCANGGCRKRSCSQPKVCVDPKRCQGGCICKKGYTKAENGTCIPISQCPESQCPDGERYEICPDNLCDPQNCSQVGFPINCTALSGDSNSTCPGEPGCVCDNDYVKDDNGECIPRNQCPSCGGDANATSGCGINCGRLCSNYKQKNVPCILLCLFNACDCKPGFVYDSNVKKCVRPRDCTPTCKINEVYDDCANGGCRKRKCSEPISCVDVVSCEGGCICQDGYTRADNGTCIPVDQCPESQCPDGERYETCPDNLCDPQNCTQVGFPINCTALSGDSNSTCPGEPGCVCDNDYVKDANGECIPRDQCPSCGGDANATSGCGINCGRLCSNYKQKNVPCILLCLFNACDCKPGFVYDSNVKKCVRPRDCTPTCKINEVYDDCANGGCRKRKCSEPISCVDVVSCEGGCICQDGYTRADNGTCIPVDQCPESQCPAGEKYEECPDNLCNPQNCSQLGFPIDCPALSGNTSTGPCPGNPGCVCNKNYVRDAKGNCIPPNQCPSCGGDANATSGCGINCGRLCSNYQKKNVVCILSCEINSCDCKEGFVLDTNINKCVIPEDCTPTCQANEVYDNCSNGGCRNRTCSEPLSCRNVVQCEGGCVCRDGYTRASNGTCIPVDQCPVTACGTNEVYDKCSNGGCRKRKCSEPKICINLIQCIGGCVCRYGYTHASNGTCIPINQCPELQCNGPNEVLDTCPTTTSQPTCEDIGKICNCPLQPAGCGEPVCHCAPGFYRNKIGECISEEDCQRCTGPNEYFSCGGVCDNVCATINKMNQTNCPFVNIQCNQMCYCLAGFARDSNGTCIPIDQCPAPQCADDEIYEECPSGLGVPLRCSQLGFPINCPPPSGNSTCLCPGTCICDNGNVRDRTGKCIPKNKCPSCGGDKNAVTGCGNHCGRSCSDYKKKSVVCSFVCNLNGCDCKKGFVYKEKTKKCVRPKHC